MRVHVTRKCLDTDEGVMGYIDYEGSFLDFFKSELNKVEESDEYEVISATFNQEDFQVMVFCDSDGAHHTINCFNYSI